MENNKQALSQFLIDPIMDDKAVVPINALWLQTQLRALDKLRKSYGLLENRVNGLTLTNQRLRTELSLVTEPKLVEQTHRMEVNLLKGEIDYLKRKLDNYSHMREIDIHA